MNIVDRELHENMPTNDSGQQNSNQQHANGLSSISFVKNLRNEYFQYESSDYSSEEDHFIANDYEGFSTESHNNNNQTKESAISEIPSDKTIVQNSSGKEEQSNVLI